MGFLQNRENSDLIFQIEYFTGFFFFLEKLQVKILLISQHNFAYFLLAFILLFNLDNKIAIYFHNKEKYSNTSGQHNIQHDKNISQL